jgi:hypothetical protein
VQTQNDRRVAIALINVMNSEVTAITRIDLGVMGLKVIARQMLKLAIGRSKNFHCVAPSEVVA